MHRQRKPNVRVDPLDYSLLASVAADLAVDNLDVISIGLRAIARTDPQTLAHLVDLRRREKQERDRRRFNRRMPAGATHD